MEYLRAGGAVIFICLNNNADRLGAKDIIGAYFFNPSNEALRLALGTKLALGHIQLVPKAKRNAPTLLGLKKYAPIISLAPR